MASRWLKVALVVTVAFAFSVICVLVARSALGPLTFLCVLLTLPGFAITQLCFGPDLLGTSPIEFLCLTIAFNTLIYSGLFGLFLMFVGESPHRTAPSTRPGLKADDEVIQAPSELQSRRRVRRILAFIVLLLLLPFVYGLSSLAFSLVPPMLVRVVDAVSGGPIPGLEVTERIQSDGPDRTVSRTTGRNGYVLFAPYLHWNWPGFFSPVTGHSIAVNEKSMAASPWRPEVDLGRGQTNKYFPMILTGRCKNCELLWRAPNPASEDLSSSWRVTVPLIPALDSPDKCSSVANPTVSKQCNELNTYRSAFLHFDSIQDVENNKAICGRLKDQAAKSCLADLAGYVYWAMNKDSSPFEHRQMPMLPTRPLEEVLPFDTIAGLAISNRRTCCNNAFIGSVTYSAEYGWPSRINVRIDDYLTEDAARQAFSASPKRWNSDPRSTLSDEIRSGNRITVFRSPHIKTASGESGQEIVFWRSAHKVITFSVFLPVPKDEEGISQYLALYPSSLTQDNSPKTQVRILDDKSPKRK